MHAAQPQRSARRTMFFFVRQETTKQRKKRMSNKACAAVPHSAFLFLLLPRRRRRLGFSGIEGIFRIGDKWRRIVEQHSDYICLSVSWKIITASSLLFPEFTIIEHAAQRNAAAEFMQVEHLSHSPSVKLSSTLAQLHHSPRPLRAVRCWWRGGNVWDFFPQPSSCHFFTCSPKIYFSSLGTWDYWNVLKICCFYFHSGGKCGNAPAVPANGTVLPHTHKHTQNNIKKK